MSSEYTLTVTMQSDWHVGAGTGRRGGATRLIRRDVDQLPFLPAKTLTGIWRDACEQVAFGLDEGRAEGPWQEWVHTLFGDQSPIGAAPPSPEAPRLRSPIPATVTVSSARLPEALRQALAGKPALRRALTFLKPGVRIDPNSGAAMDQHLRFDEMARMGLRLEAKVTLALDDSADLRQAEALLWAGAQFVARLGGGRRRGAGRASFSVSGLDREACLKTLEKTPAPPRVPAPDTASPAKGRSASGPWYILDLIVEVRSPIVIRARTAGNVVERLDYLPGTYLLPLLTKRCRDLGEGISPALLAGDVVVTHATVDIGGAAGRPFPAALQREKSARGEGGLANLLQGATVDKQLKGSTKWYVGHSCTADHVPVCEVPLSVAAHNIVNDEKQRPTEDVVGVYTFQAIPAGTRFRAQVRLRAETVRALADADPRWWEKLSGECRVGLARKGEYGEVTLTATAPVAPPIPPAPQAGDMLYVWLLSDLLLRSGTLRATTAVSAVREALQRKLGVSLREVAVEGGAVAIVGRQRRTESWHTGWQLPRPTLAGLAAGTCLAFIADTAVTPEALGEVLLGGLGERCPEGYGQLSINDPLLAGDPAGLTLCPVRAATSPPRPPAGDSPPNALGDPEMVRQIQRAAWREAIRRAALEAASRPAARTAALGVQYDEKGRGAKPKQSQLMSFLAAVRQMESPNDDNVQRWLNYITKTKGRKKDWEESVDTIRTLLTDGKQIWRVLEDQLGYPLSLEEKLSPESLLVEATQADEMKRTLWSEALWTLVDACVRAHKRSQEKLTNASA